MGSTVLELSKLCMYEFFYDVLKPSFKDLMLHYMDTDCFVLNFSEVNIDDKCMDLRNLDNPFKTNNKVPGKFKHERGSREIKKFIVLKPKTYSLVAHGLNRTAAEKGVQKKNNANLKTTIMHLWKIKRGLWKNVEYKKSVIRCQQLKLIKEV